MKEPQINFSNRIFGLDVIRAFSILMVLFSHSSVLFPADHGFLSKLKDLSGFFGIEFFFGLSGFLIGSSIYKLFVNGEYRFRDVKDFLLRRLLRILPSYYLVLVVNWVIFLLLGLSTEQVWRYFLMLQNFSTPISSFFPESWSMPVKELGYFFLMLVLFLGLFFFRTINRKQLFYFSVILLVIWSFAAKITYHYTTENLDLSVWSQSVRSVVIYRLDSVLLGLLLGCLTLEFPVFFSQRRFFLAGLGVIFFMIFMLGLTVFRLRLDNAAWFWNVFCLPAASLIVLLFFPVLLHWRQAPECWTKPVRFLCNVSYSVYLIHYSIVLFVLMQIVKVEKFSRLELNVFFVLYLALTLLLSYLFYRYFEKPINQYRLSNYKL